VCVQKRIDSTKNKLFVYSVVRKNEIYVKSFRRFRRLSGGMRMRPTAFTPNRELGFGGFPDLSGEYRMK
jgi:hypothetical protein